MYRLLKIFLLSCCAPLCAVAQISPKEGAALNYRIIGFSFPEKQQTTNYKVQVAPGNYTTESSFIKNVAITAAATKNKLIAEVPSFGKQYTWRVVYERGDQITTGELHHFSTLTSPYIDPDSTRMRVTDTAVRYKDNYVFTDGNKVLYDMKGQPVWFLPKMEKLGNNPHLRDLKATPFGTITAIIDLRIYEISYDGTVLWRGPNNSAIDKDAHSFDNAYHHEFTRLANGHYMVMGFEQEWWQLPTVIDSITCAQLPDKIKHDDKNVFYQKMYFSTLTEYDAQGKTIWEWKDGDYFRQSDLYTRMTPNKLFNLNDTHANAFYFDEKTKTITVSFRDINRVIKIRYPDGKVLTTYGTRYPPRDDRNRHLTNGVFCGQHSCRLTDDGQLYLFNNNICHNRSLPSIIWSRQIRSSRQSSAAIPNTANTASHAG